MKTLVTLMVLSVSILRAQDTPAEVTRYLSMVEGGQAEQVRSEIPSLLAKYPNNPAVFFLQGLVTVDGTEAVRTYQSIVDNFPKSEWADDALYKVYQFYYAIGLYRTAEIKLNQLKASYPASKYVTGVTAVETRGPPARRTDRGMPVPGFFLSLWAARLAWVRLFRRFPGEYRNAARRRFLRAHSLL